VGIEDFIMATMVENAQEMVRLAVRVSRRRNIGIALTMIFPESRGPDDDADPVFGIEVVGEADYAFRFNRPQDVTAFIQDLDAENTDEAFQKAIRRQRRQQLKDIRQSQADEITELDNEFSGEG
jgi:hypothetical protein